MSMGGTVAVNRVLLTNFVTRLVPFHFTTDFETKFDPFTVSINPTPPAVAEDGESDVVDGTGLLTVNVSAAEVPPPGAGLVTVTFAVPVAAMFAAGTDAVILVPLTKIVNKAVPF